MTDTGANTMNMRKLIRLDRAERVHEIRVSVSEETLRKLRQMSALSHLTLSTIASDLLSDAVDINAALDWLEQPADALIDVAETE